MPHQMEIVGMSKINRTHYKIQTTYLMFEKLVED